MNISSSIRKLTRLFIVLFLALSVGLVYWQVVVAQQVTSNIHNSRTCLQDSAPIRGRIFDRNGLLLAESVKYGQPLHDLYGKPTGQVATTAVCGYLRHYTMPSLAGVIGYYISPLFNSAGIEKQFNDYLSGTRGLTSLDNSINQTLHRPPVGDDIYLSIDARIQDIVDKAFDTPVTIDNVNTFATNKGSVIVTDPHTGEVLAMLSRPGYDPNRVVTLGPWDPNNPQGETYYDHINRDPDQPLLNRPLDVCYVPGSTFKTATLLSALNEGTAHLSDPYDKQQALGPVRIGNETFGTNPGGPGNGDNIASYTHHYPVDLRYGFVHSDNIIFAQVGRDLGVQKWLDYMSRFYIGKQIPFDLPVKVSTVTPQDANHLCSYNPQTTDLTLEGLAEDSFGQGANFVTPFQMTLFDNAIANNGTLMQPILVKRIVDPNGTDIVTNNPTVLDTPITSDTASQVRDAMYGVVRCGSGRYSVPDPLFWQSPWAIIAKTGTGQVPENKPAESWLLTQAPYQNPRLTIVAMKENGGEGASIDGPMIQQIYDQVFTQVIKDVPMPPAPDDTVTCAANDSHY